MRHLFLAPGAIVKGPPSSVSPSQHVPHPPRPVQPDLPGVKAARRTAARARRATLVGDRARAAAAVAAGPLPPIPPDAVVAGFHSLDDEFDVLPLLARLRAVGHAVALPVVVAPATPLEFRLWREGAPLERGVMNIPVPAAGAPVVEPDVLFVPLLEYDRHGFRLGYGGGFYDRTIARLRALKPVTTIGVGFAGQEVEDVPHDGNDMPLDWLLTEEGLRATAFNAAASGERPA